MENIFGALAVGGLSSFMMIFIIVALLFYFLLFCAGITVFVFWIIALVDVSKRDDKDFPSGGDNIKLVWVLLLVFVWISSIPYYFLVIRNKRTKDKDKKALEGK